MNAIHRKAIGFATASLLLLAPLAYAASDSPAALQSQAKVTEADAKATALAKVPNGAVKSSHLERERGRLVWSFDVSQATTQDITEVQVDAKSGKIVSVKKETPAQEAKEAKSANNTGK